MRGRIAELVMSGAMPLAKCWVPEILEDADNELPGSFRSLMARLLDHLKELEAEIQRWHRNNPTSLKLAQVGGVGPLTASAISASVGDARTFKNGRQMAAWLGIVPRQHSTGGKSTLLGISKRGDTYLRTLLIHGARAVIRMAERKPEDADPWLKNLLSRRHKNVAAVALANKNARILWALLAHDREYQADYRRAA